MTSVTFCSRVSDIGIPASAISCKRMISIATMANGWSLPLPPPAEDDKQTTHRTNATMVMYREVICGDRGRGGRARWSGWSWWLRWFRSGPAFTSTSLRLFWNRNNRSEVQFSGFCSRENEPRISTRFGIIIWVRGPDTSATLWNYWSCHLIV